MRALCIAIAGAVFRPRRVAAAQASVYLHLDEVDSTVHTTRKGAAIDGEGELLVQQLEHLVGLVGVHQISARSDIGPAVAASHHILQLDAAGRGSDAICALVALLIDAIYRAVLGTCHRVGAHGLVPHPSFVAIPGVVLGGAMDPPPVSIHDDAGRLCLATPFLGALHQQHRGVLFLDSCPDLLRCSDAEPAECGSGARHHVK
mmetsp:Transcript_92306/g.197784  ORF Transcript_92306/g.197784 Transcript_92306/m.197784 type:complete len:203 (+) Transcript_92306:1307-1915(+)